MYKCFCFYAYSLNAFLKGVSAKSLGIGEEDDVGYVQCPDPGEPYTSGGTVVLSLEERRLIN
jgi:hypothetical protein